MSRALRRQQLIQKPPSKGPSFRPTGPRPAKKAPASGAEVARKRTLVERIPIIGGGVRDVLAELRKVTWPTREETTRLGIAVIAVSIAMGILLGGVDVGFNWIVDNTLLR
jgi:preprotein translocase subunit SecE